MARAPYTDASRYAATATATILASNLAMTIVAAVNNQAEVLGLGISPARMLKVMCTPGLGSYKWHITSPGDQRSIAEMEVSHLSLGSWIRLFEFYFSLVVHGQLQHMSVE